MPDYLPPPLTLPVNSTVWAYLRDSGGPTQGESIDRQRDEISSYCSRHGLQLVHVFVDEARSGGSADQRDDFRHMISLSSRPDHPTGLLIWDFARFSRSLDDATYYKAILRRNGLVIHSLTDAIPEGPYSRLVELIIDIADEEKRRQVSTDTTSGLRRIVEQYGAMPGPVPMGYCKETIQAGTRRDGSPHILHRWVPDPDKVPIVLQAFEMRAAGATFDQIRKATGLFASKNSYTTFFNNTVYKGEMWFSGKTYPCEPIVTSDLWDAVQRMGELRGRGRYAHSNQRRASSNYILSGLAYCQECGGPLYGYHLLGNRHYYICGRSRRRHDCSARHVPAFALEGEVVRKLLDDVLTLDNLMAMQSELSKIWIKQRIILAREQAAHQKKLSTIQRQITHLTDAIGKTGYSRALADALQTMEKERDQLEYILEHGPKAPPGLDLNKTELKAIMEQIRCGLMGDDVMAKKSALHMVVSRVLVRRLDAQVIAIVEYHLPDNYNSADDAGGIVSAMDCGPDGIRTRDLGLDRAACLAATPRVQKRAEYTIPVLRRQGAPAP